MIRDGRLASPMVGRGPQLETLLSLAESVRAGQARAAAVVAALGLGKSRLLAELRQAAPSPLAWITTQGSPLGEQTALDAIDRLLFDLLGLGQLCPPSQFDDALERFAADYAPDERAALGNLSAHHRSDAERAATVTRLIAGLARTRPVVVAIEDVHRDDAVALALLGEFFRLLDDVPLLLLVTTCEEPHVVSSELAAGTEVRLEPLDRLGLQILAASLLELDSLPLETRNLMLEQAAGNPLYVGHAIRLLIDADALRLVAGHWRSTDAIAQVAIPDSVNGVISARVDLLPPDARRVLSLASCLDGQISPSLLEPVATAAGLDTDVAAALAALEAADLLELVGVAPGPAYRFSHVLVHAAVRGRVTADR